MEGIYQNIRNRQKPNLQVIGIPQAKGREIGAEALSKKIMAENCFKSWEAIMSYFQEVQWIPIRIHTKQTPWNQNKIQEKAFKTTRRKKTFKGTKSKLTVHLSAEIH